MRLARAEAVAFGAISVGCLENLRNKVRFGQKSTSDGRSSVCVSSRRRRRKAAFHLPLNRPTTHTGAAWRDPGVKVDGCSNDVRSIPGGGLERADSRNCALARRDCRSRRRSEWRKTYSRHLGFQPERVNPLEIGTTNHLTEWLKNFARKGCPAKAAAQRRNAYATRLYQPAEYAGLIPPVVSGLFA